MDNQIKQQIKDGAMIPAIPLALDNNRKWDERRQRAVLRYYFDAGVGGVGIGVHTTQFEIRKPEIGLFQPVLELGIEEIIRAEKRLNRTLLRVAGICGKTSQAVSEAKLISEMGYHAGLLNVSAMNGESIDSIVEHCRLVAEVIPVFGFYLQTAVGGVLLPYEFWRRFAEIENVAAIKMAPFNRYQTFDVVRAVIESGREDIALYTGNDDNIVIDMLAPYRIKTANGIVERRITGALLGHYAVWTKKSAEIFEKCKNEALKDSVSSEMLILANEVTDTNAVFYDAANNFAGCRAGLHEVLRRQGIFENTFCLDSNETLGAGQIEEIHRVYKAYPHLNDDDFVAQHLDEWLS